MLEIGAGGDPHPQASILLDRYPDADGARQRGGLDLVRDSRPLIQADGSRLPFRDGQFDYVIASHVLEHVPDPAGFVAELQRVAEGGYIETPSLIYERMRAIPEHLWFVHLADGVVYLAPRSDPDAWTGLTDVLFDQPTFRRAVEALADVFFVGMEWQQSLRVVTCESLEELIARIPANWMQSAVDSSDARQLRLRREKPLIRRFARAALPPIAVTAVRRAAQALPVTRERAVMTAEAFRPAAWRALVVCPQCLGSLVEGAGGILDCTHCGKRFRVRADDVPCLLLDLESCS